jgi:hypothetical protein
MTELEFWQATYGLIGVLTLAFLCAIAIGTWKKVPESMVMRAMSYVVISLLVFTASAFWPLVHVLLLAYAAGTMGRK